MKSFVNYRTISVYGYYVNHVVHNFYIRQNSMELLVNYLNELGVSFLPD